MSNVSTSPVAISAAHRAAGLLLAIAGRSPEAILAEAQGDLAAVENRMSPIAEPYRPNGQTPFSNWGIALNFAKAKARLAALIDTATRGQAIAPPDEGPLHEDACRIVADVFASHRSPRGFTSALGKIEWALEQARKRLDDISDDRPHGRLGLSERLDKFTLLTAEREKLQARIDLLEPAPKVAAEALGSSVREAVERAGGVAAVAAGVADGIRLVAPADARLAEIDRDAAAASQNLARLGNTGGWIAEAMRARQVQLDDARAVRLAELESNDGAALVEAEDLVSRAIAGSFSDTQRLAAAVADAPGPVAARLRSDLAAAPLKAIRAVAPALVEALVNFERR